MPTAAVPQWQPSIDIHPHIIANDTKRYPLAPLGGHQSDWSRTRPVSTEQMIAAMDKAGRRTSRRMVQASTCYGHDNSYVADAVAAHPDRFTGVFSVDVLAADAPERMRYWVSRGLTGMRLFTIGSTMPDQASWLDDPKTYPAWECAGELGLSVCLQMSAEGVSADDTHGRALPEGADHPRSPGAAGAWRTARPTRAAESLFALARYPNIYLKLTPRSFTEVAQRQGDAGNVLSEAGLRLRRRSASPGARTIRRRKARCPELLALAKIVARLPAAARPGLDLRQDRADRCIRRSAK